MESTGRMTDNKTIIYICNTDSALFVFRYPLLKALTKKGYRVIAIVKHYKKDDNIYLKKLNKIGILTHYITPKNNSIVSLLYTIKFVIKIINRENPIIVHCFTHSANFLGVIASFCSKHRKKINIYLSITGLGRVYTDNDFISKAIKFLLNIFYLFSFKKAKIIYVQNRHDYIYFEKKGITNLELTAGSGLSPEYMEKLLVHKKSKKEYLKQIGSENARTIVLLPSRSLYNKGIKEYYIAVNNVAGLLPDYVFVHYGMSCSDLKHGWNSQQINKYLGKNIHYFGYTENLVEIMAIADIVVLPSYREGTPRSLIEALYLDKFIITTNSPGCDEIVYDNWNGYLIPPKSSHAIESALMKTTDVDLCTFKGRSKKIYENKYHSKYIVQKTLANYFQEG